MGIFVGAVVFVLFIPTVGASVRFPVAVGEEEVCVFSVGSGVGALVRGDLVPFAVGSTVGFSVGFIVGLIVGCIVGSSVGLPVGFSVGFIVGLIVGCIVGASVGSLVGDFVLGTPSTRV